MIYSIDKMLNIIPSKYQLVYVAAKRAEKLWNKLNFIKWKKMNIKVLKI